MSKPVPVHAGSPRLPSPGFALLVASRCLTASPVSRPVHGVSTTSATTADACDHHQPAVQNADPASQDLSHRQLEYEISAYGCALSLVPDHSQCPCGQRRRSLPISYCPRSRSWFVLEQAIVPILARSLQTRHCGFSPLIDGRPAARQVCGATAGDLARSQVPAKSPG